LRSILAQPRLHRPVHLHHDVLANLVKQQLTRGVETEAETPVQKRTTILDAWQTICILLDTQINKKKEARPPSSSRARPDPLRVTRALPSSERI